MSNFGKPENEKTLISRRQMLCYGLTGLAGVAGGLLPTVAHGSSNVILGTQTVSSQGNIPAPGGVRTGYFSLDFITGGFHPSDLILIAGRPDVGKTAFALNIAMRVAIAMDIGVQVYSPDLSVQQALKCMLSAWAKVANVESHWLLTDEDQRHLREAKELFSKAPLYIDDSPALSILEMHTRTRRLKAKKEIGLVIVDGLQLRQFKCRQDVFDFYRKLKTMAKELDVPVIALTQLKPEIQNKPSKRPKLSDIWESGAVEHADMIISIHREVLCLDVCDRPLIDRAKINIVIRNGSDSTIDMIYAPRYTAFEEEGWRI